MLLTPIPAPVRDRFENRCSPSARDFAESLDLEALDRFGRVAQAERALSDVSINGRKR